MLFLWVCRQRNNVILITGTIMKLKKIKKELISSLGELIQDM